MAVETNPARESSDHRELRQAVGRQLTRTILFCALSLVAGIGIGHYFLQQQMRIQQGVVGQLQREIRGLTGDIQRMELQSASSVARFEQVVDRLERARQIELAGEFRGTQQRLKSLERQVERQVEATQLGEMACLAEFEAYRRKKLAVPVEIIAEALDRMVSGRSRELNVLLEEVRAHADHETARLAAIEGRWLMGADSRQQRSDSSALLSTPLAAFVAPGTAGAINDTPEAAPRTLLPTESYTHSARSITAVTDAVDAVPYVVVLPRGASTAEENTQAFAQTTELVPVPDKTLPAPRPMIGTAGRRRHFGQLISFGSGRLVEENAQPRQSADESADSASGVSTATAPGETESR